MGKREELLQILKTGNPEERQEASKVLSSFPDDEVLGALVAATMDPDLSVRYFAKKSMRLVKKALESASGKVEKDYSDDEVVSMLSDPDYKTRLTACTLVGERMTKKLLRPLLDMLKTEKNEYVIATVVKVLGKFGDSRAIPLIKPFLAHYDSRVRANTVEALGYIQVPEVYELVVGLLVDEDNRVRANVAKLLWKKDKLRVLEKLREMLKGGEDWMRDSAIYALSEIASTESRDILLKILNDDDAEVQDRVSTALSKVERLIDEISYIEAPITEIKRPAAAVDKNELCLTLIGDRGLDFKKRIKAIATLAESENPFDVSRIFSLLKNEENEFVLSALARFIGEFGREKALEKLVPLLKHPSPRVRANTIEGVSFSGDPRTADLLMPFLDDKDSRIAANAAKALWPFAQDRVTQKLLDMIKSGDKWEKTSAVHALGSIDSPEAREILVSVLRDDDPELVRIARTVIDNLGIDIDEALEEARESSGETGPVEGRPKSAPKSPAPDKTRDAPEARKPQKRAPEPKPSEAKESRAVPATQETPAEPASEVGGAELVRMALGNLAAADPEERNALYADLSRMVDSTTAPVVVDFLDKCEDKYLRSMLVKVLGATGDPGHIDTIAAFLGDGDSRVRANAIEALALIRDQRVVKLVVPLLEDEDNRVKANAAKAMWEFSEIKALSILKEMLDSPNDSDRESSIHALGEIGISEIVGPLTDALSKGGPGSKMKAIEALERVFDRRVIKELEALAEGAGRESGPAREFLEKFTIVKTKMVEVEKKVIVTAPAVQPSEEERAEEKSQKKRQAKPQDSRPAQEGRSGSAGRLLAAMVFGALLMVTALWGAGTLTFVRSDGPGGEPAVSAPVSAGSPAASDPSSSPLGPPPSKPVEKLIYDLRNMQFGNARDESIQEFLTTGLAGLQNAGFSKGELMKAVKLASDGFANNAILSLIKVSDLKSRGFVLWDEDKDEWISSDEFTSRRNEREREVTAKREEEARKLAISEAYVPKETAAPELKSNDAGKDVSLLEEAIKGWKAATGLGTPDRKSLEAIIARLEGHFRLGEMVRTRKALEAGKYAEALKEMEKVLENTRKGNILWDADTGEWRAP